MRAATPIVLGPEMAGSGAANLLCRCPVYEFVASAASTASDDSGRAEVGAGRAGASSAWSESESDMLACRSEITTTETHDLSNGLRRTERRRSAALSARFMGIAVSSTSRRHNFDARAGTCQTDGHDKIIIITD